MTYDETLDFSDALDATYQMIVGQPIHSELLTHLLWRLLVEDYAPERLRDECRRRAREDAGLPADDPPAPSLPAPIPVPSPGPAAEVK